MAYELGAWSQMVDQAILDNTSQTLGAKALVWGFKAFLKGTIGGGGTGVWSVVQSCDSVSVATDGTDLWLNTYDPTKLVRGTGTSVRSWEVLQSPSALGSIQVCLECSYTSDAGLVNITYAKNFSGGTTTARPTDSQGECTLGFLPGSIVDLMPTYTHKLNGILSPRGDFFFQCNSLTRGPSMGVGCVKLLETKSNDQWPWAFTGGCLNLYPSYNWVQTYYWQCRTSAGSTPTGTPPPIGVLDPFVRSSRLLAGMPATGDAQDHLLPTMPAYVGICDTTYGCIKGRIPDCRVGCQMTGQAGTQSPATGNAEYTLIGGLWMPFTQAPTF